MKKLLALFLIVCVVCAGAGEAFAVSGFVDVNPDSWYGEAVTYVTENGYFNGVSQTHFDPSGSMTRGMFITALGRMANVPEDLDAAGVITKTNVNLRSEPNTESDVLAVLAQKTTVNVLGQESGWYHVRVGETVGFVRGDLMSVQAGNFNDVAAGKYYAPYVQWAVTESLVSGTSSGYFSPDQNISREQLCTILYNFTQNYGIVLAQSAPLTFFSDDAQISSWARNAVYAMQAAGIINGRENNAFAPKEGATRAEVAIMLQRFALAVGENMPNVAIQFGVPVPESEAVGESYFDDVCFIGHSIVVGMSSYFQLDNADFYAVNGISASGILEYDGFELEAVELGDTGELLSATGTLAEVLEEQTDCYGKVYIMLGTNELGPESYHLSSYADSMCKLIDLVRESQPTAKIYVIATLPVSQECSENSENFNRENVQKFNTKLLEISAEKEVYYIDAYSLLVDEEGYLPAENCLSDGIHILGPQYAQLKAYLQTHTA